jgi:acetylglutamate/LysW-gamma-L-alpha-aminoadipate kinase
LIDDIKKTLKNEELVIVHGGGREVTEIAEKLGKPQSFIVSPSGIRSRYTDKETIKIYAMVMAGKINKELTSNLLKENVQAVGLSGVDGNLLKADRKKRLIVVDERGRRRIINGGFTGKISQVNDRLIKLLTGNGYVPVISSLAIGAESELLNVDSDRAAAQIAGASCANKIIFLTDVPGVLQGRNLIKRLVATEAEKLMQKVGSGMDKKIMASLEAVKMGVDEAIIAPGDADEPITKSINHLIGTVITRG